MSSLIGKTVGVFGLGKSGLSAIALAQARGAQVVALDEKPEHPESPALKNRGIQLALGPAAFDPPRLDLLVVSPGVPLASAPIQKARAAGVEVIGEIEFAARSLTPAPFIGITGTN